MPRIVECVPNFSEGRRKEVVDQIVAQMASVDGVLVLDQEMDYDHNRAVITMIGEPERVKEAAFRACKKAAELIDLNKHKGEHPRMGATDVIPFIPVSDVTVAECITLAKDLAQEIAQELGIPTYLYEKAATRPERESLPNIRKGEFEGLREAIRTDPDRAPDYGEPEVHPTAGATVVGVRDFLIAYNVNLGTGDVSIAKNIAKAIRDQTGGFRYVRAAGFELSDRGIVQVSMNMLNYEKTSLFRAFEFVKREAERYGVQVVGSEIVGLTPLQALVDCADWYLRLEHFQASQVLENRLLGMAGDWTPTAFLHKLAGKDPAPGGGSAAALSGAMAAALTSMVGRLTVGKKAYAQVKEEMTELVRSAESLRARLTLLIKEDTDAFNAVIAALKAPEGTDEEKKAKEDALNSAYERAATVPLTVMDTALEVMELASVVAEKGNPNSVSDAGVAALCADTAVKGAALNVRINLPSLADRKLASELAGKARALIEKSETMCREITKIVEGKLAQ
jgi:glutamate formiminotransferase/formiminotetrahydrofolate cyclodeaminase